MFCRTFVAYFHVVFTLPAEIADIAYQNKSVIYDLLFKASTQKPGLRPLCANKRHQPAYSITLSARASNSGGTWSCSARAVFRLSESPKLVGCSIGRSPGFAPLRIRST
jgi:hypothetical protein